MGPSQSGKGASHPGRALSPFPFPFGPNFPSQFGTASYLAQNPLWGSLSPSPPWGSPWGPAFGSPWGSVGVGGYAAPVYGDLGAGVYGPGAYPVQTAPLIFPNLAVPNVTVVLPPAAPAAIAPAPIVLPQPATQQIATRPEPPPRESVLPDRYPAVIAVRNGSIYSAEKYWITGKTLHFLTTNGETHQIPLSMLERLYPPRKGGD